MKKQEETKKHLFCPYCDEEIINVDLPYCQVCRLTMFHCPKCRKLVARDNKVCPHCGAAIR